jgi:hypothetical protein
MNKCKKCDNTCDNVFCIDCTTAALAQLQLNEQQKDSSKAKCYLCEREFLRSTLSPHGGFCGRCIKAPSISKGKKPIDKSLRASVWKTYASETDFVVLCYCCNIKEIDPFNFECGHIQAEAVGGETTLTNLRPICGLCNKAMGTKNMKTFAMDNGYDGKIVAEEFVIIQKEDADDETGWCKGCIVS